MVKLSDDEVELLRIIADGQETLERGCTDVRLYIMSKIKNYGPNGDDAAHSLVKLIAKGLVEESYSKVIYIGHPFQSKNAVKFHQISREEYETLTKSDNRRIIYKIKDPKILEGIRKLM